MAGKNKSWVIELGFYPGILTGFRTYDMEFSVTHVFYLPFVDIALIIEK
jgi:hypothetical protein|tara:strand:+ start:693 stop:839 length:147 start_codon:yes stop_codon:yes gene_type:complete